MPILPAELDQYPLDLWERGPLPPAHAEDDDAPRWWCLHTRPRQEKATARHLLAQRLPFYLPLIAQESRTPGGRKLRSILPLFTGYLFLYGNDRDRVRSLQGNTLVQTLPVPDQEGLDRDLRQIRRLLASGLSVVPEPDYPVGATVRVTAGPLEGLIGVVARRENRDRFVAMVHFLGRGATVELQDWQVEQV